MMMKTGLAIILAGLFLTAPAFAAQRTCSITEVSGTASVSNGARHDTAAPGLGLSSADTVKTGPDSRVEIACSDETHVTIGPDTEIGLGSLVGEQGETTSIGMSLHQGIARFLAPVRTWGTFNVFGPVAVASVRSTEWAMETPKRGTNVFVLHGVVDVTSKRGDFVQLQIGEGVDVAADGTMAAPKKWGPERVAKLKARLGLQ